MLPVKPSRRSFSAGLAAIAFSRGLPVRAEESRPWLDPKLLVAAKKEGPLTVYSSTNEQEGLPLFKIFEEATGLKFNYIRGNDASLISRIAIEMRANQPSFDIVHMTNAHKMPQQLLAQFDPPEAKHILPDARDPNRRWYGVYTVYTTPAYNTKLIKPDDLPKSFEDFAKRKEWAGRVAIDHTDLEWLRGIMQFFGEQKGTALVREIAANLKPVITDGRLAMARSLAAGEYLFALNNFVNLTLNVKLAGGAVEFFPLDPVPLFFAQVAVSARAPNPNTARLAANYMLSAECQVFYSKFGRLPTRTDVETNPPGIIKQVTTRKVIRTQFSQAEEKRLRASFDALLRGR
jgi:iron(III) transport system substrate-binding protein